MLSFLYLFLTSYILQPPKDVTLDKVVSMKPGMHKSDVVEILGIPPYDPESFNYTRKVFIYVDRVTDRRSISFNTKPVTGKKQWVNNLNQSCLFDGKRLILNHASSALKISENM
jgi:outer membrane protein assembly factor BamE (lipoprotein component of BamABCDE complex)